LEALGDEQRFRGRGEEKVRQGDHRGRHENDPAGRRSHCGFRARLGWLAGHAGGPAEESQVRPRSTWNPCWPSGPVQVQLNLADAARIDVAQLMLDLGFNFLTNLVPPRRNFWNFGPLKLVETLAVETR